MNMLNIRLDGIDVQAPEGETILDAAARAGIRIPSLCYLKEINCACSCHMCVVEADGRRVCACAVKVREGMSVQIFTPELEALRKETLEKICADHRQDCSACGRFPYCELHELCRQYGLDDRKNMFARPEEYSDCGPHMIRDNSKCISCSRCISACSKVMGIGAIRFVGKGKERRVQNLYASVGDASGCIYCGQCILACPTGALMEKSCMTEVAGKLSRRRTMIAVVTQEAVLQLAQYFGTDEESAGGKTAAMLRRLGFAAVYTETYGKEQIADACAQEISARIRRGETGLISTYCPGVHRFLERSDEHKPGHPVSEPDTAELPAAELPASEPEMAEFPAAGHQITESSAEEAHSMESPAAEGEPAQFLSALHWKEQFAEIRHLAPGEVSAVVISSCTADKAVRNRPEFCTEIDYAMTTHELYTLIGRACVSSYSAREVWEHLPAESFDSETAADRPGETRLTVMERIVDLMGLELASVKRKDRDGCILELQYRWEGEEIRFARVSGLSRVQDLMKRPEQLAEYAFVEAMACPGGCLHGAGASRQFSGNRAVFAESASANALRMRDADAAAQAE